jgi:hypothetical protein
VLGYGRAEIQEQDFENLPGFGTAELTGFQDFLTASDPQWTNDPDVKGAWWPQVAVRG